VPTALITGITGQDGSYLAEMLLEKGYTVYGLARRESWFRQNNASHLRNSIQVLFGDMAEGVDLATAVQDARPDEIYNLAAQSRPGESWARSSETLVINGLAAIRLFEAVRHVRPECRVYHASSSEMFGRASSAVQDESTPFNPQNPYATGILFNHESERRPLHFVTQKIAYGAACAALGVRDSPELNELGSPIVENGKLALGNLDIERDWGHARDFVRAMWLILQQSEAADYVVGTGVLHTLRDLCELAYRHVGLNWRDHVVTNAQLARPLETVCTVADPARAHASLGWSPALGFDEMVQDMVNAQIRRLRAVME